MRKIAFVVQRCGREVLGGAERHCLDMTRVMSRHWNIDVLTTCAADYLSWANAYAPGDEMVDGVRIRRFPVDRARDLRRFNRFSEYIQCYGNLLPLAEQQEWMRRQGPLSAQLEACVRAEHSQYEAFVFFTYLYATTYFLMPLVRGKAYLAPFAHDEWPIYLNLFEPMFREARALLLNTESERAFLQKRFPHLSITGPTAGVGVSPPAQCDAAAFRAKWGIPGKYLLYVGRVDRQKGCGALFEHFQRYSKEARTPYTLVVAGQAAMEIPEHPLIRYVGPADEQDKWNALAGCDWLVNPSPFESLSIVLLEAWAMGRPVLVTAASEVMVRQCLRSNGGLWYDGYQAFRDILVKAEEPHKRTLGANGRRFVSSEYSWERLQDIYLETIK